uniref:Uncharacterized protein n=1 Tax=Noctiluca scintillans TaxID=2966 RepID=A0A7S1F4I0_NOCSC|mmetsp:Transcript_31527/g.84149  ORF Transcript_31527/g.84149 Transcript_31527/m.84149 type:complete len:123 (+) Transcript_31527:68-436(+)
MFCALCRVCRLDKKSVSSELARRSHLAPFVKPALKRDVRYSSSGEENQVRGTAPGSKSAAGWVVGGVAAVFVLLVFHGRMITERERREGALHHEISELKRELSEARSKLREFERERFLKPRT